MEWIQREVALYNHVTSDNSPLCQLISPQGLGKLQLLQGKAAISTCPLFLWESFALSLRVPRPLPSIPLDTSQQKTQHKAGGWGAAALWGFTDPEGWVGKCFQSQRQWEVLQISAFVEWNSLWLSSYLFFHWALLRSICLGLYTLW